MRAVSGCLLIAVAVVAPGCYGDDDGAAGGTGGTSAAAGNAGTGSGGRGGTGDAGGIDGAAGTGGAAAASGAAGASGTEETGGSGGGEADDACSGYPEGCFPLCEGGICDCYCESAAGTGGAGAGGSPAAGEGGTGAASGSGGAAAGSGGTGAVDCDCARGGYAPVCGVDGNTYDAICGIECVPVAISCTGECPCLPDVCDQDCAASGLLCCNGSCVNADNDRLHCGDCATQCPATAPYCDMGTCTAPPCESAGACQSGEECCGAACCSGGQICCLIMAGPWFNQCVDPVEGTCPVGCPLCVCADPDTMVATPDGERRIADIAVGDTVYSVEDGGIVVVPVRQARRTPVSGHRVVRITLETGRTLELSARHPTAEGEPIGEIRARQLLDGVAVTATETIPYRHNFTYDILPGSESGVYFASGVAIGSTLR